MKLITMFTLMAITASLGGQNMVWWSTIIAKIISAVSALFLKQKESHKIQTVLAE